jgi:beta-glucosidase
VGITNVGSVPGSETVQIYVRDEKSRLPRPEKELVAFEKVKLDVGETKHLRVVLDKYAVGFFDTKVGRWVAEVGAFRVLVGASAGDIKWETKFDVDEEFGWVF